MKFAVYDIEILKNLFTVCFYDFSSEKKKEFVIFDHKDQLKEFVIFLKRLQSNDYILVGFNSLNFDSQLVEFILQNYKSWLEDRYTTIEDIISEIYGRAQEVINTPEDLKYKVLIPEWKLSIPQIDLFKQKHYDGTAKIGTSLKWIQFSMRYHTVEEMPINHDEKVSKEEIPLVLSYNWNDVLSTVEFFKRIKFETDLRSDLSTKYNLNLINASEPRLAKMIFGKFLCEDMGITMKDLRDKRTYRKNVKLKNVIFPYVKFESKELNDVFDVVKNTNISFEDNTKFKHNFTYGGINTDIGLGGIHACCDSGVYESSEDWVIEDIDVVSFYPNLAIQNNIKPLHLGDSFSRIYNNIFQERKKIPKKDPTNYVYKIILNSTYGLSKEINSYLYDPFFTYSITINGQLSLLMLVEKLVRNVEGLKIYQENTDGITIGYNVKYREDISKIVKEWCKETKLETEHAFYKKMVIRDVNNYIAVKDKYVKEDGTIEPAFDWNEYQSFVKKGKRKDYSKIKHKGIFELDLDYHKNPSFIIIPLAVEAYFLGGIDPVDFIKNHRDIYDFLGAVKRKKNFDLNLYKVEKGLVTKEEQQKVTRYYISTDGGSLVKDFTDGRKVSKVSIEAGWKVTPLNKVEKADALLYNIDYNYYISEAQKLIDSINPPKLLLL